MLPLRAAAPLRDSSRDLFWLCVQVRTSRAGQTKLTEEDVIAYLETVNPPCSTLPKRSGLAMGAT